MATKAIKLSRLAITKEINDFTPFCVLLEIADAHGINYDEKDLMRPNFQASLKESIIMQENIPEYKNIENPRDLQHIARFINKYKSWPKSKLIIAYNFLSQFISDNDPLNLVDLNSLTAENIGLQTPDNPSNINACILYKTCIYHGIKITVRTTLIQMFNAVKLLNCNSESLMRRVNLFLERDVKRIDLINILMFSPYAVIDPEGENIVKLDDILPNHLPKSKYNYEIMSQLHESLSDLQTLRSRITPNTHEAAIALAALNYGLDISKANDNLQEYRNLQLSGRNSYIPVDPWMNYWYARNPSIFDLSVSFNPLFPSSFYNENHLANMTHMQGYTSSDYLYANPYELLQLSHVIETFHVGEFPNLISRKTSIDLDDIDEISYGQLLSFGQMEETLQPITMNELINLFNANQNFTNPFKRDDIFSELAIKRLKNLLIQNYGPLPNKQLSTATLEVRRNLVNSINQIEIMISENDDLTRQFILLYTRGNYEIQCEIRGILYKLLDISMYMRGWKGNDDVLPVIKTIVSSDYEPQMTLNITNSMNDYQFLVEKAGSLGIQINNLPLVRYRGGEFQVSILESNGLTIGDRLNIIRDGDKTSNLESCIRLSSNWLAATAYKYLTAIRESEPFNIDDLREIS